jgi:membrane-associated phospholipid phosphatase
MLLGWGLGALCTSLLTPADLDAVRNLAAHRAPGPTLLAHIFSWLGSGYTVYPVALAFCVSMYRRARQVRAVAVAVGTAGAVALYVVDKALVGRHRPPLHHLEVVHGWSFPSGHATQTTALTVALLIALLGGRPSRHVTIAAFTAGCVLVAGVCFSRVYLGVHYPSDVAAGMLVGATWSGLASWLISRTRAGSESPSLDDAKSPCWTRRLRLYRVEKGASHAPGPSVPQTHSKRSRKSAEGSAAT